MAKIANLEGPHRLDIAIGHRIRERRRGLGMSQQELAEAIGVTFQQVQKYERGSNRVSFSRLASVAAALRCHLADLAEGLEAKTSAGDIDHMNALTSEEGALELLEAYVSLPTRALRLASIHHLRELGRALKTLECDAEPPLPSRQAGASVRSRR